MIRIKVSLARSVIGPAKKDPTQFPTILQDIKYSSFGKPTRYILYHEDYACRFTQTTVVELHQNIQYDSRRFKAALLVLRLTYVVEVLVHGVDPTHQTTVKA